MVGVVLATFSREGNSNFVATTLIDSFCINIAPSTSVTACKGSASGKDVHMSSGL